MPRPWLTIAFTLAGAIGYAGYRAHALTPGGGLAACLVGGTIFGFGGLPWAVLIILFFVSSSALSFVAAGNPRKRRAATERPGWVDSSERYEDALL